MKMTIYDTKQRRKVAFSPEKENTVRMYTCGPTIYNFAHIGNLRTFVFEDLLRRTIKFFGMKVFHVMNLTDVDDKTIAGAIENRQTLLEFTKPFEIAFHQDLKTLEVEAAEKYPKATEFIDQMIVMIEKLIDKGFAYRTDSGDVYFRIKSFPSYGKLSHLSLEDLDVGRSMTVDADEYDKESATDFVLWKGYDDIRDGDIYWKSPFGKGRPGWHMECSCMSMHYLGETFDLHTGGVDNIFPHHENEIAQSEALSGKTFSRHWMHSEHLLVEGKKMSKSLGNFYTLRDLLKKGYSGKEVRMLFLASHYRAPLNFTFDGLMATRRSLARIDAFVKRLKENSQGEIIDISSYEEEFAQAIADDLNTPQALAVIFEMIRSVNYQLDEKGRNCTQVIAFIEKVDSVFGCFLSKESEKIEDYILQAAQDRYKARQEKDFSRADTMRAIIENAGYVVEDTKERCLVRKKEKDANEK
jgi:cysteinyl-tRNA synthetase